MVPEAEVWNYKVVPSGERGFQGIQAIQDAVKDGLKILNCSWGVPRCEDGKCSWCVAAENAAKVGVLLFKSAGNNGRNGDKSLTCPANCNGNIIVVGATVKELTDGENPVPIFSSKGPASSGKNRPDIVAPGHEISSCAPGGGFAQKSGTSMASPHMAGIAALMMEKEKDITPEEFLKRLGQTAIKLSVTDPNIVGAGLVNADKLFGGSEAMPPEEDRDYKTVYKDPKVIVKIRK